MLWLASILGTAMVVARPSLAIVELCDDAACLQDFAACEFDIDYGATGGARSLGALHVFGLGTLINPEIEAQSGLTLDCSVAGSGTNLLEITTEISNQTASPVSQLRFFAVVNPDGNMFSANQDLLDVPGVSFGATGEGEPDFYGIDELANMDPGTPGNIDFEIFGTGLTNSNYCGAFCDVVFALQWNAAVLLPGETLTLTVGFSDTGQVISQRFLTAARADDEGVPDDPDTVLTLSGVASVSSPSVPFPRWGLVALAAMLAAAASAGLRRPRFSHPKWRMIG